MSEPVGVICASCGKDTPVAVDGRCPRCRRSSKPFTCAWCGGRVGPSFTTNGARCGCEQEQEQGARLRWAMDGPPAGRQKAGTFAEGSRPVWPGDVRKDVLSPDAQRDLDIIQAAKPRRVRWS